MPADLAAIDAILKQVYRGNLVDLLNSDVRAYRSFSKAEKEQWEGKDFIIVPLRVGRNEGFGFGRPRGPVAEAGNQAHIQMKVDLKYGHGRINIDAATIKVAKTNRGSYKRPLALEMDGLREDLTEDMNRIIFGDGRGILALVDGAGADTTELTVDAPGGFTGNDNGARFLQPNQKVAIISADGTTLLATRRITQIGCGTTNDGQRVTLNQAVSAAQAPDNAILVRCPNLNVTDVADTSYNREPMGLSGHIDDGTNVNVYHQVNRTTYDVARSTVFSGVGALSTDKMQQAMDVAAQLGKGRISEIWCHHSVRRSYAAIVAANRVYMSDGGANMHNAGWKGNLLDDDMKFGEAVIKVDKDAPFGTMFFCDTRYFVNYENTPGEWVDEDGAILSRVPGQDTFEAMWRCFLNFANEKANASARLDGISTNLVVVHVR